MENKFRGKALNLKVVVEEVFNENKTASGIDLSAIVDINEKQKRGRVVSIGEQCPKLADGSFTLKEGDEIIFDKHKMDPFTQDGISYLIIDYRDIVLLI